MKDIEGKCNDFLIFTNPLFWVAAVIAGLWELVWFIWRYIGLVGWYQVYFKLSRKDHGSGIKAALEVCEYAKANSKTWYTRWRHGLYAKKIRVLMTQPLND